MSTLAAKKRGKPVETIQAKGIKVPIYASLHHGKPSFVLAYYLDGRRKRERASSLPAARQQARTKITELSTGTAHISNFTAKETAVISNAIEILRPLGVPLSRVARDFADAVSALPEGVSIVEAARYYAKAIADKEAGGISKALLPEVVGRFMADLRERGRSQRYLYDMQARLAHASKAFPRYIHEIQSGEVDEWLEAMNISARTKNNYRSAMTTLFSFARRKGHLSRHLRTEAEFASRYDGVGADIGIYTPSQLETLLTKIGEKLLPFVAIGAFAGLRTAEIARLDWQDVLWDQGYIEVKKAKAKTASRRLVPILPCLRAWLSPLRKAEGPVLDVVRNDFDLSKKFRLRVAELVDDEGQPIFEIVHNGLRHSFVTYRLATEKNAAAVALEAGNSPKMLFQHYRELATEAVGRAWFSILPPRA